MPFPIFLSVSFLYKLLYYSLINDLNFMLYFIHTWENSNMKYTHTYMHTHKKQKQEVEGTTERQASMRKEIFKLSS
jgi:hypothetical protein